MGRGEGVGRGVGKGVGGEGVGKGVGGEGGGEGEANYGSTYSKVVSPLSQARYNECKLEERQNGKTWYQEQPSQGC